MHSGADLDAFTAALNRDIEGDTSASQPSDSEIASLSQEGSASSQGQDSTTVLKQNMNNQRAMNQTRRAQVPFALLLPIIIPQLDKDRAMQLNTLYQRLKKNEVSKYEFIRHMRSIAGDHLLKMAAYELQMQTGVRTNQLMAKPEASAQPPHDAQMRQGPVYQSMTQAQMVASAQAMTEGFTLAHVSNSPTLQQNTVHWPSSISKEQKYNASSFPQENEQQLKSGSMPSSSGSSSIPVKLQAVIFLSLTAIIYFLLNEGWFM